MTPDNQESQRLEEMLARSYEPLGRPIPSQRQAVVNGFLEARCRNRVTSRRAMRVRAALLTLAACLVMALTARLLLVSSSAGAVYGFEAIPQRLLDVQTIRLRGTQLVYDSSQPDKSPTRVPFEYLVKRPDKFRMTWIGVSQGNGPVEIRHGTRLCDGQNLSNCNDTQKQYSTGPLAPLSARIETESFTQGFVLSALLGPPDAPFRKVGEENVDGRWCHLYEGRFGDADQPTTVTKLWFDPMSGHPVRLIRDNVRPDGTAQRDAEIDEIAVNVPLPDELFRLSLPEDYQPLAPPSQKTDQPVLLSQTPTGSAAGTGSQLEVWHAFQISERAALLVWRRSVPEATTDGALDWLSNVEFELDGPPDQKAVQHTWIHQSGRSDRWNWSMVVLAIGQLSPRDRIDLQLQGKVSYHSIEMLALRFSDDVLEQILTEAARVMLPDNGPRPSLAELRAQASKLLNLDRGT